MFHLDASIKGPNDSLFKNKKIELDIHFPTEYPFKPPVFNFITKLRHWNVDTEGIIKL